MNFKGKKLYRSRKDRLISGVCGGLGEYFEVNSNIVRFIFLVSNFFLSGISTLVYFILAGVIPGDNKVSEEGDKASHSESTGFSSLINILSRLNKQPLRKHQNRVKPNELERKIYSQERKDVYSQSSKVELDGHETRSGINIDWRAKLMIVLVILSLGYFLWKSGLVGFLNF
jgi:phage shock protein PspC (stress-responsive transcriptional regulator)